MKDQMIPAKPVSLPCCPHCKGMLFEVENIDVWNAGVAKQEATYPGYTQLVNWLRGKCFPSFAAAQIAYATRR
jgi:hypothetical protein